MYPVLTEEEYDIAILEGKRDAIIGGHYREDEPVLEFELDETGTKLVVKKMVMCNRPGCPY